MSSNMPSRTPTLISHHSGDLKDKARPSSSTHSLSHGADDNLKTKFSDSPTPSEKDVKKIDKGPERGMVAPLQLTRFRFWAIFLSLMISIFLFALG